MRILANIGHLIIERRCGNLFAYSPHAQTKLRSILRFYDYITFSL